jgi:hypothetical protein
MSPLWQHMLLEAILLGSVAIFILCAEWWREEMD